MQSTSEPRADERFVALLAQALELLEKGDLPSWGRGQEMLVRLGRQAVPSLLERLAEAQWTTLHYAILEALGRIGDPAAIPVVAAALEQRDARRRLAAIRALRRLDDTSTSHLKMLDDADWQVRQEAVFALGDQGGRRLVPPLVRCLRDPHHRVRAAAANALGRIEGRGALAALRRALADEHDWVRSMAAWSIRRLAPGQSAPASACGVHTPTRASDTQTCVQLVDMLEDPAADVREKALDAVGRLRCLAALGTLEAMVCREAPALRRKAAWAMARMGQPAREPLERLLRHADAGVQECAIFALGQLRLLPAAGEVLAIRLAESGTVKAAVRRSLDQLREVPGAARRRK